MTLTDKIVEFNLSSKDLSTFNNANVPFEELCPYLEDFYYPTFWERLLRTLNFRKIPLRNRTMDANSILTFFDHGIPPTLAGRYCHRFNAGEMLFFYERGFPLRLASHYITRFSVEDILILNEHHCPPEEAERYHLRFNGEEIARLWNANCIPEVANNFRHTLSGQEIADILIQDVLCGHSGELIRSLSLRNITSNDSFLFDQRVLDSLRILGVPLTEIPTKKQRKLGHVMRTALLKLSIWNLENKAQTPFEKLANSQILGSLDINPEDVKVIGKSQSNGRLIGRLIKRFTSDKLTTLQDGSLAFGDDFFISKDDLNLLFSNKEHDAYVDKYLGRYRFLGTGRHSLVILDKDKFSAYKFSLTGREEIRLLYKLAGLPVQNNTARIKRVIEFGQRGMHDKVDILELEYIPGKSLHQHLEKENFPQERTVKYSSGILNGLLELRQAGIWHHRDIRPANIMIDEEKDRAVIIDLGIATTDKDALAEGNRRFGSPSGRRANDLNSLGQVVYKMAAGEHIFAESKSMEMTTYANKLRDHRDWIYERPEERLPPYLRRVEETVKDEGLCGIVKFCLNSEGTDEDYKTLEARFKEYGH